MAHHAADFADSQRGSATGLFHSKDTPWRQSQRERLHWFSNNASDDKVSLLVDRGADGGLVNEQWKVTDLNEAWLDVGISGKPNQVRWLRPISREM